MTVWRSSFGRTPANFATPSMYNANPRRRLLAFCWPVLPRYIRPLCKAGILLTWLKRIIMSYEQNSTTNSTLTLKVERVEDPASSRVQPEDLGIRNLRHGHFIFSVLRGSLQDTTYTLNIAYRDCRKNPLMLPAARPSTLHVHE